MAQEIDPLSILAELGCTAPRAVTRITGGWDTSLWRVELGAVGDYALRVFRPEQAPICAREAVVMRALAQAGLPVPDVAAEGVGQGRPALLIDWCPGSTVLAQVRHRPLHVWRLGTVMGKTLAHIHAYRVSDAVLSVVPAWTLPDDGLPPLVSTNVRLRSQARPSLLHLDYHPLNVMCVGSRVSGVLDWANVRVGDARVDLARTITLMRLAPSPPGTPLLVDRGARLILEAAWRAGYRSAARDLRIGDGEPFDHLDALCVVTGTLMERDLRPKLGRPGVWLTERHLARIRRWTQRRAAPLKKPADASAR